MYNDRIEKLRTAVQLHHQYRQIPGDSSGGASVHAEQALALLRDDIHAMRFDDGGGYIYAQTLDNVVVLHGVNPALEGKPAPANVDQRRRTADY